MESARTLDSAIAAVDRALRAVFAPARASRPAPATPGAPAPLTDTQRRQSAALMRVNHAGRARRPGALPRPGRSVPAGRPPVRCSCRRPPRGGRSPRLVRDAPQGARLAPEPAQSAVVRGLVRHRRARGAAGRSRRVWASSPKPNARSRDISRSTSTRLPPGDARSRAILEAMRAEEIAHGASAAAAGGAASARAGSRADAARRPGHDRHSVLDLIEPAACGICKMGALSGEPVWKKTSNR